MSANLPTPPFPFVSACLHRSYLARERVGTENATTSFGAWCVLRSARSCAHRPILLNGTATVEEYFSLKPGIGGGRLRNKIRDAVAKFLTPIDESHERGLTSSF